MIKCNVNKYQSTGKKTPKNNYLVITLWKVICLQQYKGQSLIVEHSYEEIWAQSELYCWTGICSYQNSELRLAVVSECVRLIVLFTNTVNRFILWDNTNCSNTQFDSNAYVPRKLMQSSLWNEVLIFKCATSFVTSVTHQCASQVEWAQLQTAAEKAGLAI